MQIYFKKMKWIFVIFSAILLLEVITGHYASYGDSSGTEESSNINTSPSSSTAQSGGSEESGFDVSFLPPGTIVKSNGVIELPGKIVSPTQTEHNNKTVVDSSPLKNTIEWPKNNTNLRKSKKFKTKSSSLTSSSDSSHYYAKKVRNIVSGLYTPSEIYNIVVANKTKLNPTGPHKINTIVTKTGNPVYFPNGTIDSHPGYFYSRSRKSAYDVSRNPKVIHTNPLKKPKNYNYPQRNTPFFSESDFHSVDNDYKPTRTQTNSAVRKRAIPYSSESSPRLTKRVIKETELKQLQKNMKQRNAISKNINQTQHYLNGTGLSKRNTGYNRISTLNENIKGNLNSIPKVNPNGTHIDTPAYILNSHKNDAVETSSNTDSALSSDIDNVFQQTSYHPQNMIKNGTVDTITTKPISNMVELPSYKKNIKGGWETSSKTDSALSSDIDASSEMYKQKVNYTFVHGPKPQNQIRIQNKPMETSSKFDSALSPVNIKNQTPKANIPLWTTVKKQVFTVTSSTSSGSTGSTVSQYSNAGNNNNNRPTKGQHNNNRYKPPPIRKPPHRAHSHEDRSTNKHSHNRKHGNKKHRDKKRSNRKHAPIPVMKAPPNILGKKYITVSSIDTSSEETISQKSNIPSHTVLNSHQYVPMNRSDETVSEFSTENYVDASHTPQTYPITPKSNKILAPKNVEEKLHSKHIVIAPIQTRLGTQSIVKRPTTLNTKIIPETLPPHLAPPARPQRHTYSISAPKQVPPKHHPNTNWKPNGESLSYENKKLKSIPKFAAPEKKNPFVVKINKIPSKSGGEMEIPESTESEMPDFHAKKTKKPKYNDENHYHEIKKQSSSKDEAVSNNDSTDQTITSETPVLNDNNYYGVHLPTIHKEQPFYGPRYKTHQPYRYNNIKPLPLAGTDTSIPIISIPNQSDLNKKSKTVNVKAISSSSSISSAKLKSNAKLSPGIISLDLSSSLSDIDQHIVDTPSGLQSSTKVRDQSSSTQLTTSSSDLSSSTNDDIINVSKSQTESQESGIHGADNESNALNHIIDHQMESSFHKEKNNVAPVIALDDASDSMMPY